MRKENKMNKNVVMAFCLALALVLFMIFFVNIPVSPEHETTLRHIKFDWIGLENKAFIDSDIGFSNPFEVKKGEIIVLEPGQYYWRISKIGAINGLSIDSEVSIINKNGSVKNTGNVQILVEFFKRIGLTSKIVLDVDESKEMEGDLALASEFDDRLGLNQTNQSQENKI